MITQKLSLKLLVFKTLLFSVIALFPLAVYPTSLGKSLRIATQESLSSSTVYGNLTTPDTVTVTLNQQSYVTVMYNSSVIKTGCLGTQLSILSINGVQQTDSEVFSGLGANAGGSNNINYTVQLAAGSYNFNILHRVDGCTGFWQNRSLTVLIHT